MRKFILVLCLLLMPSLALANPWTINEITVDRVYAPVGVVLEGNTIYVSSMGPSYHKEVDGYIIRHNLNEQTSELLLENQINSPKSFAVFEGQMLIIDPYASKEGDGPSLVLANINDNKIINRILLPQDANPHDILAFNSSTFIVSDSKELNLYMVTLKDNKLEAYIWLENIPGLKGLGQLENTVYAAGTTSDGTQGCVYSINPFTPAAQEFIVVPQAKMLNAVSFHGKYMFASDWGSKKQEFTNIYIFETESRKYVTTIPNLPGPSSLVIAGESIYLPVMTENKIIRIDLDYNALDEIARAAR